LIDLERVERQDHMMRGANRNRVVVIGGGQAGGRLTQILGANPRDFDVTLVCEEPHPPYERPPLTKGVLTGKTTREHCLIWREEDDAWRNVELRLGVSAIAIDREANRVHLSDGEKLGYDTLVLATGSSVRRFSVEGAALKGVHYLRNIDDSLAIARRFEPSKRLVVVGGGFIGLEIAASARAQGIDTTLVEASDRLLARVVPSVVADQLANRHRSEGVRMRMGAMVERFVSGPGDALCALELSTGEVLPCDLAVIGVGVKANSALAVKAGLSVDVGVRVDASLRTDDPSIFACGDVATFWHPLFNQYVRVEAWQNAEDHARVVAKVIMGEKAMSDAVPWFWSDQYDLSLQIAGLPTLGSSVAARLMDDGALILFHFTPSGKIVGATGLGKAESIGRDVRLAQILIADRAHPDPALLRDPAIGLKSIVKTGKARKSVVVLGSPVATPDMLRP
jgi:3-phenylpropionate/trans-cinnamate dioxygenase ferredoxin reductase component